MVQHKKPAVLVGTMSPCWNLKGPNDIYFNPLVPEFYI